MPDPDGEPTTTSVHAASDIAGSAVTSDPSEDVAWVRRLGLATSLGAAALAILLFVSWPLGLVRFTATPGTWPALPPWMCLLLLVCAAAAACLVLGFRLAAAVLFAVGLAAAAVFLSGYSWEWLNAVRLFWFPDRVVEFPYEWTGLPSSEASIVVIFICAAGLVSCLRGDHGIVVSILLGVAGLIIVSELIDFVYSISTIFSFGPAGNKWDLDMALAAMVGLTAVVVAVAAGRPRELPTKLVRRPMVVMLAAGILGFVVAFPLVVEVVALLPTLVGRPESHRAGIVVSVTLFTAVIVSLTVIQARRREWRRYSEVALDAVLVTDAAGVIKDANPVAVQLLGCPVAQLQGTQIERWVPHGIRPAGIPMSARRADGTEFPVEISLRPVSGKVGAFIVVAMRDRTEDERVRADRDRLKRLLTEAMEQSPIAHVILDLDGRILEVNEALCRLAGVDAASLIGRSYLDFQNPNDAKPPLDLPGMAEPGPPHDPPTRRWIRPDGAVRWVELHVSPVSDDAGRTVAISVQPLDITAQKQAEAEVERAMASLAHSSGHDMLTGLPNRQQFLKEIGEFLEMTNGDGHRVALLYSDLDDFKYVNDAISHEVGDEVLVQVADRLRAAIGPGDLIGRIGGDEFVLALRTMTSTEDATRAAEAIQNNVSAEQYQVAGRRIQLGIGIGMSIWRPGLDPQEMLREADAALRHAKKAGRNRWEVFDAGMREESQRRIRVAAGLREALDDDRIRAWYQPVVSLFDYSLIGYEALARWERPDGSVIPAIEWIDIAEENGLIHAVGERVLTQTARRLGDLSDGLWVSINSSPSQVLDKSFAVSIFSTLRRFDARPEQLVVEMTEQSILQSPELVRAQLNVLAEKGVRMFLDDFGTGYSSLTHLRSMPVSGIKLDRSFTNFSDPDEHSPDVAAGLADLAARLGLTRIAEGVERPDQVEILRDCGWEYGQGWLFGRPAPDFEPPIQIMAPAP